LSSKCHFTVTQITPIPQLFQYDCYIFETVHIFKELLQRRSVIPNTGSKIYTLQITY
jgi:hypothetical protein